MCWLEKWEKGQLLWQTWEFNFVSVYTLLYDMQVKLYLYDPKINSAYYTRKRVGKNTRITNLSLYNLHLLVHQFSLESWIMHRKSTLDFVEKIILAIKTSDTQSSCIGSKYKYVMYVMQAICLHIWHTTYSWNIKWQKCAGMGLNGFIFENMNWNVKMKKKKNHLGSRLEVACWMCFWPTVFETICT